MCESKEIIVIFQVIHLNVVYGEVYGSRRHISLSQFIYILLRILNLRLTLPCFIYCIHTVCVDSADVYSQLTL